MGARFETSEATSERVVGGGERGAKERGSEPGVGRESEEGEGRR